MKFKLGARGRIGLAVFAAAVLMAGCGGELPILSQIKEPQAFTKAESMILVATERNRYEQLYTDQIWGTVLPGGQTFEDYLLDQVKDFLQDMRQINNMAQENGIVIDSAEKEELRRLSEEYYNGLSADDIAYMGIGEEDVRTVYEAYFLANETVQTMTESLNLEVSDSEAKVVDLQRITLSDSETAQEVLSLVTGENGDFEGTAKEYSEDSVIDIQIGRGEKSQSVEDTVFALTVGQISPVVEDGGKYYIFKCVNDYNQEATQARKEIIYQQRKEDAFYQIYEEYKAANPVVFDDSIWQEIAISKDDKTTTTNFFQLYQEYFPE